MNTNDEIPVVSTEQESTAIHESPGCQSKCVRSADYTDI